MKDSYVGFHYNTVCFESRVSTTRSWKYTLPMSPFLFNHRRCNDSYEMSDFISVLVSLKSRGRIPLFQTGKCDVTLLMILKGQLSLSFLEERAKTWMESDYWLISVGSYIILILINKTGRRSFLHFQISGESMFIHFETILEEDVLSEWQIYMKHLSQL